MVRPVSPVAPQASMKSQASDKSGHDEMPSVMVVGVGAFDGPGSFTFEHVWHADDRDGGEGVDMGEEENDMLDVDSTPCESGMERNIRESIEKFTATCRNLPLGSCAELPVSSSTEKRKNENENAERLQNKVEADGTRKKMEKGTNEDGGFLARSAGDFCTATNYTGNGKGGANANAQQLFLSTKLLVPRQRARTSKETKKSAKATTAQTKIVSSPLICLRGDFGLIYFVLRKPSAIALQKKAFPLATEMLEDLREYVESHDRGATTGDNRSNTNNSNTMDTIART